MREELTPTNVNLALDELRPYIESDGGYLEFVEIDQTDNGPIVKVRLPGACETWYMSAQTLKMGIEKHLVTKFPEIVGVIQVL